MHMTTAWLRGKLPPQLAARAVVAPLVLLLVAAWHVSMRSSADLTPWKGGGFGMFSTIDSPGARLVQVRLRSDLGTTEVAVPDHLSELANEVKAAPSAGRVARLAGELSSELWVIPRLTADGGAVSPRDEALDELAMQALAQVAPVETVRAVEPEAFDPEGQRRVEVAAVEVAVLRLMPRDDQREPGRDILDPVVIRRAVAGHRPDDGGEL